MVELTILVVILRGGRDLKIQSLVLRAILHRNISAIGFIGKPCLSSSKFGMVALSALRSGCVAAQNVEVTCIRPAQLRKPQNNTKFNVVLNVLNQLYFKKMCASC